MNGNGFVIDRQGALRPVRAIVGLSAILLTAGCAGWQTPSPSDETPSVNAAAETPAITGSVHAQEESEPSPGIGASPSLVTPSAAAETPQKPVPEAAPATPVARAVAPVGKPSTPAPASPAPPSEAAPGQGEEAVPPPLDLESLERRLKETRAIGIFTKLALKNQMDDLLDRFRTHYQGRSNTSPAQLRQPFELLIMKVLAILQDNDPLLAHDILDSREAIWEVLADPEKFANL